MSDQYVIVLGINAVLTCFKGGSPLLKPHIFEGLLGALDDDFSLLGATWAHLALLAAFVVALGRFLWAPGRSELDFGGFRGGPERVLEVPRPYFSMFFRARVPAMRQSCGCAKTTVFLRFF